jgi:ATP-dependent Clp protease ATP-binding subunit ClpA
MTDMQSVLNARIKGQEDPINAICNLLGRARYGMRFPDHPVASMIFLGPTGVGKTETVLLFTEYLFGPGHLARFNMSDYKSDNALDKMLGTPSTKGIFEILHRETGGAGTLLWDELEKANPLVLDQLLQILDTGRITVASGTVLDLNRYVFAATSNVGSRELMETEQGNPGLIRDRAENAALKTLKPEILGRFDLLTTFNKLSEECKSDIVRLHTDVVLQVMRQLGHHITVTQRLLDRIKTEGYTERFGARPIRRKAKEIIGDAIRSTGGERISGTLDYNPKTREVGFYVGRT